MGSLPGCTSIECTTSRSGGGPIGSLSLNTSRYSARIFCRFAWCSFATPSTASCVASSIVLNFFLGPTALLCSRFVFSVTPWEFCATMLLSFESKDLDFLLPLDLRFFSRVSSPALMMQRKTVSFCFINFFICFIDTNSRCIRH